MFLVDGSPSGIVTAEIMNWTGHALLAPRSEIGRIRKRPESQKTGIYFLLGEVATSSEKRSVYIGESDDVGRRIEQHAASKEEDFFERFCIFTSKDANLTKAHARYLENRLSSISGESGRSILLNSNTPPSGSLPESDIADMEFFISQIELVLPVLGYDFLKGRPSAIVAKPTLEDFLVDNSGIKNSGANTANDITQLRLVDPKTGVDATALMSGGEYLVLRDSYARANAMDSLARHLSGYNALRNSLIGDGSLVPHPSRRDILIFTRDVAFRSPSAASAIILGRSDNGRFSWKIGDTGETLAQYQSRKIAEAAE
ncbi:GIY-YIG nuclease family protein [Mesorhizobium sp. LMG 17147]|uniref:GIY-YIG nuclease family protein n=1 Tax=Mesorhizobium sp. LMG 17147 TaxID=2963091 RepID=UPI0020C93F3C|nr:GIY-YIG nuclease family protein [Mesorhizobium sp. LMG 17147]MCP9229884.1 GIY-YIG nuclease family protein [Mesorhizobium sp. LMG 17147]